MNTAIVIAGLVVFFGFIGYRVWQSNKKSKGTGSSGGVKNDPPSKLK